MNSIRLLLNSAIDYAALFPPAGLGMREAVESYDNYRAGEFSWALGRFIVPASRLPELRECMDASGLDGFRLSVVGGADPAGDLEQVMKFGDCGAAAVVESIEWKAHSTAEIDQVLSLFRGDRIYFEIPIDAVGALIREISCKGARAKVRTGGVTPGVFPSPSQLAQFIILCAEARVPFKATAGLHHPLRSVHPLTYEKSSPSCTMHGFLNVLLASAAAWTGADVKTVEQILKQEQIDAFRFNESGIRWRGLHISGSLLNEVRERLFISFGSCSFEEPVSGLKALKLL